MSCRGQTEVSSTTSNIASVSYVVYIANHFAGHEAAMVQYSVTRIESYEHSFPMWHGDHIRWLSKKQSNELKNKEEL